MSFGQPQQGPGNQPWPPHPQQTPYPSPFAPQGPYAGQSPYAGHSPYGQPLAYGMPLPPRRSGGITACAVVGIIWASLGLLNSLGGLAMYYAMANQLRAAMGELQYEYNIVTAVAFAPLALWLLVSSIGALRLSPWARTSLIVYAVFYIVFTLLQGAYGLLVVVPDMIARRASSSPAPGFETGAYLGFSGALLVCFAYPIVLLIIMRRPEVIDAFLGRDPSTMGSPSHTAVPHGYAAPPPWGSLAPPPDPYHAQRPNDPTRQ